MLSRNLHGGRSDRHSSKHAEAFGGAEVRNQPIDLPRAIDTLSACVLNYGPLDASRLRTWPLAAQVTERLGWTMEQLSAWLGSLAARQRATQVDAER